MVKYWDQLLLKEDQQQLLFTELSSVGTADFVVTAFNYIPYISTIDVVPASGPYIVYTSNIVNDASGNNNGLIDYGENIC